jgi:hypothetical protein
MPHHPPDVFDNILGYTLVAANALKDVSTATQIPFLKSVCSLAVSLIPMIEVREPCRILNMLHSLDSEYKVSKGTMSSYDGGYLSHALCTDGPLLALRSNKLSPHP